MLWKALFLGVFLGNASGAAPVSDLEKLHARGTLRVAILNEDAKPFTFSIGDGLWKGVDVEVVQGFSQKLGIKLQWVVCPSYSELMQSLRLDRADVAVSAIYPTVSRTEFASFSNPYAEVPQVLFVQRLRSSRAHWPDRLEELLTKPDLQMGYFPESDSIELLAGLPSGAKLIPYARKNATDRTTREKMIQDFIQGNLGAVLLDEIELARWRAARADLEVYGFRLASVVANKPVVLATRWDRPQLLHAINVYIDAIKRSGQADRWYRQYRGEP